MYQHWKRIALTLVLISCSAGCRQYGHSAIPFSHQWHLDRECAAMGQRYWDPQPKTGLSYRERPSQFQAFYSRKIDTCIQVEINDLEMVL